MHVRTVARVAAELAGTTTRLADTPARTGAGTTITRTIRQAGLCLGGCLRRCGVLRLGRWRGLGRRRTSLAASGAGSHGDLRVGRRESLRAVLVAAGVAVTAACGTSSRAGGAGSSGDATASSGPGQSGSTSVPAPTGGEDGGAQLIEPRDDLSSPQPQVWDSWRQVDPTTIEVIYWGGNTGCYGVRADVVETGQDVTVNLSVGTLPGVDACTDEAVLVATRVTLKEELGDREVRQDAES